jgi:purine-cytosine permease-like protein
MLLGLSIPQLFGTFLALASNASSDFSGSLVSASPSWYLFPLLLAATCGSIGNAGVMLYSMGLDLDAILPHSTRIKATLLVAIAAIILVFLGHFVWNSQNAMTSFVLLLTAIGTPWAVIILIAHFRCPGYDAEALQTFNFGLQGGVYWYYSGWNPQATLAWAFGSIIGLLSVSTPMCEGPLVTLTMGIDLSFVLSGIIAGFLYLALLKTSPNQLHNRLIPDLPTK